jgi:pantoate--beta-alanine ligase
MNGSAADEMQITHSVADFRAACDAIRRQGGRLGLVPTMGALHAGHLALVAEARKRSDRVALSIFVNPTQFGPHEDLEKYPRPIERDLLLCREAGVSIVFTPPVSEMYDPGEQTRVQVSGLTDALCGPFRPNHFDGVATIVTKLFSAAGACTAVFGRKDYQQLQVVKRMARDLLLPVDVVGHPTLREADGLALSSRNVYLGAAERERALAVPRALSVAARAFASGERSVGTLRSAALGVLEPAATRIDYLTLADADSLRPFANTERVGERALLATAAYFENTRLIDNLVLGEDSPPS